MKALISILLCICVVEANKSWFQLSDTVDELEALLQDTRSVAKPTRYSSAATYVRRENKYSAKLNDHLEDEGSGVNPTEEKSGGMFQLVNAAGSLMEVLSQLREEKENKSREYAAEFVLILASNSTDDDIRALFGKHVRLLHESCQSKLLHFTKQAHASDVFDAIDEDEVEVIPIVESIIEKVEKGEGRLLEEFAKAIKENGLQNNPRIKLIMSIGGLVADAACDFELDGFMKEIGKAAQQFIAKKPKEDESSLTTRVSKAKRGYMRLCQLVGHFVLKFAKEPPLKKLLGLIFHGGCNRAEAEPFFQTTYILKNAILLGDETAKLRHDDELRRQGVMNKIEELRKEGKHKKANILLAKFAFDMTRRGLLSGVHVKVWLASKKDNKRLPHSKNLQADDKTVNTRAYDKLARTLRGTDS
ncbi:uncharacterized protein LOC114954629 isoform X2 [Acropora millepora]|nr:uncharacterized protein LOC114954629 isoform X2 [Acropora millepora]